MPETSRKPLVMISLEYPNVCLNTGSDVIRIPTKTSSVHRLWRQSLVNVWVFNSVFRASIKFIYYHFVIDWTPNLWRKTPLRSGPKCVGSNSIGRSNRTHRERTRSRSAQHWRDLFIFWTLWPRWGDRNYYYSSLLICAHGPISSHLGTFGKNTVLLIATIVFLKKHHPNSNRDGYHNCIWDRALNSPHLKKVTWGKI